MPRNKKQTGNKAASTSGKLLRLKTSSKAVKRVAASDLSQSPYKAKAKKKNRGGLK